MSVLRNKRVQINGKVFQAGTLDIRCFLSVASKACSELTSLISCGKSLNMEQPFQAYDNFSNHFTFGNKKRPLSVKEKESSCLSWTLTLNLVLWLWDEVNSLKCPMRYVGASLECILKTWPSVLKSTLLATGNQFKWEKLSWLTWDLGSRFSMNLTSLFWVTCSLFLNCWVIP